MEGEDHGWELVLQATLSDEQVRATEFRVTLSSRIGKVINTACFLLEKVPDLRLRLSSLCDGAPMGQSLLQFGYIERVYEATGATRTGGAVAARIRQHTLGNQNAW